MRVESKIWRGNNRGVGFATIPKSYEKTFKENETVRVNGKGMDPFFAKIKRHKNRLGVYVSKDICSGFIGSKMYMGFNRVNGFHSALGGDGRLYIPNHIAEKFRIRNRDVVFIRGDINGQLKEKFCLVKKRERGTKREDLVMFDSKLSGNSGIFNIVRKLPKKIKCSKFIENCISGFHCGQIDKNRIIIYSGKMKHVIINLDFSMPDLSYYLGAYFSDGMKRGFNWGITASTFEQARFYIEMHRRLILNSSTNAFVTFTGNVKSDAIRKSIAKKWNRALGLSLHYKKIRLVKTNVKYAPNRNKNGSLTIREGKQILLLYYRSLIKSLLKDMEQNPDTGFDFLCGILEGDGCANARGRGHISIATNEREKEVIIRVLNLLGMKYNVYRNKKNSYNIRIGALDLIRNLPILKSKIFRYYPKRRKRFIERFQNVGAVRFIAGRQKHASGWVKRYLKDSGILDDSYMLTSHGKQVKRCIKDMIREIS